MGYKKETEEEKEDDRTKEKRPAQSSCFRKNPISAHFVIPKASRS